jgi:hypothetical protein
MKTRAITNGMESEIRKTFSVEGVMTRLTGLFIGCVVVSWFLGGPAAAQDVPFIRGDVNADGRVDIADPIRILSVLFVGGADLECKDSADADDDGTITIADAMVLIGFDFLGGPGPLQPFPSCGVDPTPDGLRCESSPGCIDVRGFPPDETDGGPFRDGYVPPLIPYTPGSWGFFPNSTYN